MKRWNGWGEEDLEATLAPSAEVLLRDLLGEGQPRPDADLVSVLESLPKSRLEPHRLISTQPLDRMRHAVGQSLPDWVALRSGRIATFPDAVARPTTLEELREVMNLASDAEAVIIPYGGGTSVVGHLTTPEGRRPVLTLSMAGLTDLERFDEESHLATFGAGIRGPDLEDALRARGFTLGHYPQSFEYSTLGGWVVTRSSGQQSLGYGRIEDLFAGGSLLTPAGDWTLPPLPASAAGPDLRHLVLGSEGRLGVLAHATVRVRPLPEEEAFHGVFFPHWNAGVAAVRKLSQASLPLSMMRLSNTLETQTNLALAGKEKAVAWLHRYLGWRGLGEDACLLLIGFSGQHHLVQDVRAASFDLCRREGGVHGGRGLGEAWKRHRFRAPYLRNTLWDLGYAVDTLETAVPWTRVTPAMKTIERALHNAIAPLDERVHVFTHLSHAYSSGSSLYTTYVFRLGPTPDATLERWHTLKQAASQAIVDQGGTISHQHGVGLDHREFLHHEKGELGIQALDAVARCFDPDGMMNPGKLIP